MDESTLKNELTSDRNWLLPLISLVLGIGLGAFFALTYVSGSRPLDGSRLEIAASSRPKDEDKLAPQIPDTYSSSVHALNRDRNLFTEIKQEIEELDALSYEAAMSRLRVYLERNDHSESLPYLALPLVMTRVMQDHQQETLEIFRAESDLGLMVLGFCSWAYAEPTNALAAFIDLPKVIHRTTAQCLSGAGIQADLIWSSAYLQKFGKPASEEEYGQLSLAQAFQLALSKIGEQPEDLYRIGQQWAHVNSQAALAAASQIEISEVRDNYLYRVLIEVEDMSLEDRLRYAMAHQSDTNYLVAWLTKKLTQTHKFEDLKPVMDAIGNDEMLLKLNHAHYVKLYKTSPDNAATFIAGLTPDAQRAVIREYAERLFPEQPAEAIALLRSFTQNGGDSDMALYRWLPVPGDPEILKLLSASDEPGLITQVMSHLSLDKTNFDEHQDLLAVMANSEEGKRFVRGYLSYWMDQQPEQAISFAETYLDAEQFDEISPKILVHKVKDMDEESVLTLLRQARLSTDQEREVLMTIISSHNHGSVANLFSTLDKFQHLDAYDDVLMMLWVSTQTPQENADSEELTQIRDALTKRIRAMAE